MSDGKRPHGAYSSRFAHAAKLRYAHEPGAVPYAKLQGAQKLLKNVLVFILLGACILRVTGWLAWAFHVDTAVTTTTHGVVQIPNRVHFVRLVSDIGDPEELSFHFTDYLSVYAASYYWHPDIMYLHTNALQESITRARDGLAGKWTKRILQMGNVKVLRVASPLLTGDDADTLSLDAQTELVAATVVRDLGGVYLGFDVHALRDIQVFRDMGFPSVTGAPADGSMSCDFVMSTKDAPLTTFWAESLRQVYASGAKSLHKTVLTALGRNILRKAPKELLTMEPPAFVSDKHNSTISTRLFHLLEEGTSGESLFKQRKGHVSQTRVDGKDLIDWSDTYLLQVTDPRGKKWPGTASEYITPGHILTRRSNMARALYPITKMLHDKGLMELEDEPMDEPHKV